MYVDSCGVQCHFADANYPAWALPGIGRSLIFMAAHGFVFLFVIFLVESAVFRSAVQRIGARQRQQDVAVTTADGGEPAAAAAEDSDVAAERQRITGTAVEQLATTDAVVLRQLTKFYDSFLAVDRLSVGIPKGE